MVHYRRQFQEGWHKMIFCTFPLASSLVFTQMTVRQCGNVIEWYPPIWSSPITWCSHNQTITTTLIHCIDISIHTFRVLTIGKQLNDTRWPFQMMFSRPTSIPSVITYLHFAPQLIVLQGYYCSDQEASTNGFLNGHIHSISPVQ